MTEAAEIGIQTAVHYRVKRGDLASTIYRCLGISKWKPRILATARLLWLCELTVMSAMPGVSLGVMQYIEHRAPTVRGSMVTVTAACTERRGHYWEWTVVVRDAHEVLATCMLGFVAEVDVKSYNTRKLAWKISARTIGVACWLRILDAFALILVVASPVGMIYAWHGWTAMLATETLLIAGWFVSLTGVPSAISDWITVRPAAVGWKTNPATIGRWVK